MKDKIEQIELLPCPFCGGTAYLRNDDGDFWYVSCNNCINQTTHFFNGKDVVIERWNTRADSPELLRLRDAQAAAEECVGHYADKSKWFCCGPSYLHQCDAPDDRCWFTLYEDKDEGFDCAVKAQAKIKRLKGE